MKKRILAITAIFMLLFTNYAFAAINFTQGSGQLNFPHNETGDISIKDVPEETIKDATEENQIRGLDVTNNIYSNKITTSQVKMYDSEGVEIQESGANQNIFPPTNVGPMIDETKQIGTIEEKDANGNIINSYWLRCEPPYPNEQGETSIAKFTDGKYSLMWRDGAKDEQELKTQSLYLSLFFPHNETNTPIRYSSSSINGLAKVVYQDAISFGQNNEKYNLEVKIKAVTVSNDSNDKYPVGGKYVRVKIGQKEMETFDTREAVEGLSEGAKNEIISKLTDRTTYIGTDEKNKFYPQIGGSASGMEIETEMEIVKQDGSKIQTPIDGMFSMEDLDNGQGIAVEFNNDSQLYKKLDGTVKVKDSQGNEEKSLGEAIKYRKLTENENTTGAFLYANYDGNVATDCDFLLFLKNQTTPLNSTFTFAGPGRSANMDLLFNRCLVSFNLNGGTAIPGIDSQYITIGDKATTPTTNPTKAGYEFDGWYLQDQNGNPTTEYNFNIPVTENIELVAKWTPIEYKVKFHKFETEADGTNNPDNVLNEGKVFTIESNSIDLKTPTRSGYNFEGWYNKEDYTGQKANNLSFTFNDVEGGFDLNDVTIDNENTIHFYAKWLASESTNPIEPEDEPIQTNPTYKIEYYKESEDGIEASNGKKYKKIDEETRADVEIGEIATAPTRVYPGYTENTTINERIASGTVKEDGSLVLKIYYDAQEYTVKFDPQGGTPKPDDQTVKYEGKATEPSNPTRDGYEFEYWYYKDNDGKEVEYDFDSLVIKDIQLYAKWKPKTINSSPATNSKKETVKKKQDPNAPKLLANTGVGTIALGLVFIAGGAAIVFGTKYFKYRKY